MLKKKTCAVFSGEHVLNKKAWVAESSGVGAGEMLTQSADATRVESVRLQDQSLYDSTFWPASPQNCKDSYSEWNNKRRGLDWGGDALRLSADWGWLAGSIREVSGNLYPGIRAVLTYLGDYGSTRIRVSGQKSGRCVSG